MPFRYDSELSRHAQLLFFAVHVHGVACFGAESVYPELLGEEMREELEAIGWPQGEGIGWREGQGANARVLKVGGMRCVRDYVPDSGREEHRQARMGGRLVHKDFGAALGLRDGEVAAYHPVGEIAGEDEPLWTVRYDDGDEEDVNARGLAKILLSGDGERSGGGRGRSRSPGRKKRS